MMFWYTERMDIYTTAQAAKILKLKPVTIRQYCADGRIDCSKFGRDWVITEESLEKFRKERRKPGRPRHP